ncbi:MAG: HEPN domain-containing protein [Chloroflexota bacterium]
MYTGISEQAKASKHRLDDAKALLESRRWRGSMYMSGYAVECLLKTKLMQMYHCHTLHELEDILQQRGILVTQATVFTHHLELLFQFARSLDRLKQNRRIWRQFAIVNRWMPAWRYTANLANQQDAEDFIRAVEAVMDWIENNI